MPTNKRPPATFGDHSKGGNYWRYQKLSKADWADAYADLYRQVHGDITSADEVITDAENRTTILKRYRAQWASEEGPETEDISAARGDCEACGGSGKVTRRWGSHTGDTSTVPCGFCNGTGTMLEEVPAGALFGNDARAWAEDEADMQRIKDEWEAFDRDPPGS